MNTDDDPDVFEMIHRELDAVPAESWTDNEARIILFVLREIRLARPPDFSAPPRAVSKCRFQPDSLLGCHSN